MLVIIIIFLIAILSLFGMMLFQAWEIKQKENKTPLPPKKLIPEIYFRHIEKIMLYLTKYIVQSIVLLTVKYWFIIHTKTKKWIEKNWPKINKFFKKESENTNYQQGNSFIRRAILESKIKIRRIKENVKKEHEKKVLEEEKVVEKTKENIEDRMN